MKILILGARPRAFAAPGWYTSPRALRALEAAGFETTSVSRGAGPTAHLDAPRRPPSTPQPLQPDSEEDRHMQDLGWAHKRL